MIAGSDQRGTIYGLYNLSEQIGVSPWYWWADVPAVRHDGLYAQPGRFVQGPPAVKYRGIFLNDEAPDLTNWVREKFGAVPPSAHPPIPPGVANYGPGFYARVFELLLRLRGNCVWPAMWSNAFNEDDRENPRLAADFGVVMGTSHQEPMLRAQQEWDRRYLATVGHWNYATQPQLLEQFWREGIRRNRDYESLITIGLRGANDTPMAPGGPEANRRLLEKIVGAQRNILREEMGPAAAHAPQVWCLYKEVQAFYEAGLRVPDDVTLLWCDDNWGNLRRLPTAAERARGGGAGVYYHFDYHGGPRSYQWIATNPIPKIWDQMTLARQYGADRLWIVNVGHLKGYEFPLGYFLDLAWDPDRWSNDNLRDYTRLWAQREFGAAEAPEIADLIVRSTRYNGRCKPELLSPGTYSLVNYREAETVVDDFERVVARAEAIGRRLPANERDAFGELVLFPAKAGAIVNRLYLAAAKNRLYARQGRASAAATAAETRRLFQDDRALRDYFNHTIAGGKWDHFVDQPHVGYTTWEPPPVDSLAAIPLAEPAVPEAATLGVAIEGREDAWPGANGAPALAAFDSCNRQRRWIDIFNRGRTPFTFTARPSEPWIAVSQNTGVLGADVRLWIDVDWDRVPTGTARGTVTLSGAGAEVVVVLTALRPAGAAPREAFSDSGGFVSIEAEHCSANTAAGARRWIRIEDYGDTLAGMRATAPADSPPATPGRDSPCLEYRMDLFTAGRVDVTLIAGPTLNFRPGAAVRAAVAFDGGPPQTVVLVPRGYDAQNGNADWERTVEANARRIHSALFLREPGLHTLQVWMVDPGVVLEKIVVDLGGARPCRLGPPESLRPGGVAAGAPGTPAEGRCRNLFCELLGCSDAEVDAKIQAAWQQLFYGADDSQRVYYPAGDDEACVVDVAHDDVRTEGMSYGMMIAVQLDHPAEFGRLWKWAKAHMAHSDGPLAGYFSWHCARDGRQLDPGPAPDGEEWFAMALLFAAHRWNGRPGVPDYGAEAQALLSTLLHHGEHGGAVGPMFDQREGQLVFVPQGAGRTFTDPSYQLPAFYELWSRWSSNADDRIFWAHAAEASRAFFHHAANPRTGLMPDYAQFDGTPFRGFHDDHVDFRYDAWRTLANVALDHAWFAADPWQVAQSNRVLRFLAAEGPGCPNQFTLDGRPLSASSSTGFAAMAAVAGQAADPEVARPFVEALWNAPIPSGRYRYYDGLLYLIGLLETGGRFRIL